MTTFVIAKDGTKLMPTTNIKKVRKLLRSGRATIWSHDPFAIQLTYESEKNVQPIELSEDTGYQTLGLSLKSAKHEFVSEEDDFLTDEKKKHVSRRKYRRDRRNRLRYRKPRFDNRKKEKGWIAPSLKNKADQHVARAAKYIRVSPVKGVYFEMGQFDTQVLAAVKQGKPVPKGLDYQHGPQYGYDTLREAVFARDGYKCVCCGRSGISVNGKPGVTLCIHHLGYLWGDRSNRLENLATVCTDCHSPANHKKGGKLYGLKPKLGTLRAAAFMNTVKWYIYNTAKEMFPDIEMHITYGAATKRVRNDRHIAKSHANDAYCIGVFQPKHRIRPSYYEKARRHNRVLSKFYDAKWIDSRDGSVKKGAELPNGRTNRNHKRDTENLRKYRKQQVSKGKTVMRVMRGAYAPGDMVRYKGALYTVDGGKSGGKGVKLKRLNVVVNPSIKSVRIVSKTSGWKYLLYA